MANADRDVLLFQQAWEWARSVAKERCFCVHVKDRLPVIVIFVPESHVESLISAYERHSNTRFVKLRHTQRGRGLKWLSETTMRCHLDAPSAHRQTKRHPSKYLPDGCKAVVCGCLRNVCLSLANTDMYVD
jgi:hypothetical protein